MVRLARLAAGVVVVSKYPEKPYRCYECGRVFVKPQEYRWVPWGVEKGGEYFKAVCRSEWHGDYDR